MNNTPEERYAAHALYSLQAFNHTQPVPTIRRKAYTVVAPNLPKGHCKTSFTVQGATPDDVIAQILGADTSPVQRDFPVLEFIEKVWKYSPEKLADIFYRRKIRIPIRSYVEYWTRLRQRQPSATKVFATLLNHILYQISGTGARVIPAEFHHKQSASGYGGSPSDISWTTVDDVREQWWTWTISCVEVKEHQKNFCAMDLKDIEVDLSTFRRFISKHSYHKLSTNKRKAVSQEDSRSPSSGPTRKRSRSSTHSATPSTPSHSQSLKRKEPSSESGDLPPQAKRSRSNRRCTLEETKSCADQRDRQTLATTEFEAVHNESQMLSHGVRSFSSGITVDHMIMHLWYADHMVLIKSAPFNIQEELHLLLLVVVAMASADLKTMGICLFMTFPLECNTYKGEHLEIPAKVALDEKGEALPEVKFEIDSEQSVLTDSGIVGRGTTIVPIKTVPSSARFGREPLVAKMSWQPKDRASEPHFIMLVRTALERTGEMDVLRHIVDLKCSVTRSMEAMELPRAFMADADVSREEARGFRMLMLTRYDPLESVNSVREFEKVFTDVVRAHHDVWVSSNILHRDVSIGNVMLHRQNGDVCGVLCDWDLALHKPDGDSDVAEHKIIVMLPTKEKARSAAKTDVHVEDVPKEDEQEIDDDTQSRNRTGIGPFMALDLLSYGNTPYHRYRHDLESFFWLLTWFCATFDPELHKNRYNGLWDDTNLIHVGDAKYHFLYQTQVYDNVFAKAHPEYLALANRWVYGLRDTFCRVNSGTFQDMLVELDYARRKNWPTHIQEAEDEILKFVIKRNQLITYERFMELLDVPL